MLCSVTHCLDVVLAITNINVALTTVGSCTLVCLMLLSNRNFLSLNNYKVKVTMSIGSGLKGLLTFRCNI